MTVLLFFATYFKETNQLKIVENILCSNVRFVTKLNII